MDFRYYFHHWLIIFIICLLYLDWMSLSIEYFYKTLVTPCPEKSILTFWQRELSMDLELTIQGAFQATVSELWYVEEYDVLALALDGRMKAHKFQLRCSKPWGFHSTILPQLLFMVMNLTWTLIPPSSVESVQVKRFSIFTQKWNPFMCNLFLPSFLVYIYIYKSTWNPYKIPATTGLLYTCIPFS